MHSCKCLQHNVMLILQQRINDLTRENESLRQHIKIQAQRLSQEFPPKLCYKLEQDLVVCCTHNACAV